MMIVKSRHEISCHQAMQYRSGPGIDQIIIMSVFLSCLTFIRFYSMKFLLKQVMQSLRDFIECPRRALKNGIS